MQCHMPLPSRINARQGIDGRSIPKVPDLCLGDTRHTQKKQKPHSWTFAFCLVLQMNMHSMCTVGTSLDLINVAASSVGEALPRGLQDPVPARGGPCDSKRMVPAPSKG